LQNQQQLECKLDAILLQIRSGIFPNAKMPLQPREIIIKTYSKGKLLREFIPAKLRVIELPEVDILINYQGYPPGTLRGIYDYNCGKIFLCKDNWCLKTFIHEILHGVSFPTIRRDLIKLSNFFEGLTEFFTGYIMYKSYPYCYTSWKDGIYKICSATYTNWIKLWGSFCRFIPIEKLAGIYFWDGTDYWERRYCELLTTIHQKGYKKFQDPMNNPKPTLEMSFLKECIKNLKNFKKNYTTSISNILDFSQMKSLTT
jgi:hypothetical protein